jgi:hypothetical protein
MSLEKGHLPRSSDASPRAPRTTLLPHRAGRTPARLTLPAPFLLCRRRTSPRPGTRNVHHSHQGFDRCHRYRNASSHAASARRSSSYSADPFDPNWLDDARKTGGPVPATARPATARSIDRTGTIRFITLLLRSDAHLLVRTTSSDVLRRVLDGEALESALSTLLSTLNSVAQQ